MSIINLYSKRQKQLRGEYPDVFQYEELARPFRVQVVYIIQAALGEPRSYSYSIENEAYKTYKMIRDILRKEYGVFCLTKFSDSPSGEVLNFFLNTEYTDQSLDVIELCFLVIDKVAREPRYINDSSPQMKANEAIKELNERFLEDKAN